MINNVLERVELIREEKGLKKNQFEKLIGKSNGYLNTLFKNNSVPGTEVLIKILDNYPEYSANWILTGDGEMRKSKEKSPSKNDILEGNAREDKTSYPDLMTVRNEIRGDLKVILTGMTENFRVVHKSAKQMHQDHQKILRFIDDLDQANIIQAAKEMDGFLKERK